MYLKPFKRLLESGLYLDGEEAKLFRYAAECLIDEPLKFSFSEEPKPCDSIFSCAPEKSLPRKSVPLRSLVVSSLQVNIIPIIAKSDTISKSELAKFKIKITSELVSNGVQIYQFPTDDESVAEINSTMNVGHFFFTLLQIAFLSIFWGFDFEIMLGGPTPACSTPF